MRRTAARGVLVFGVGALACVRPNPAFDELDELADESGDGDGDPGDGDPGDGDPGDGDPGDGDGEPGDGDGEPGDGDGEPGDGDGEAGDGDGEPGDGDGDPNPDLCEVGIVVDPYEPALLGGSLEIGVEDAPGFALQQPDCQILTICQAEQATCGPNTSFLARINSGGDSVPGILIAQVVPIQLQFSPGKPSCGLPPLVFDPNQTIKIHATDEGNLATVVPVRLPCFEGTELRLWVADDGSTFYDPELSEPAALW